MDTKRAVSLPLDGDKRTMNAVYSKRSYYKRRMSEFSLRDQAQAVKSQNQLLHQENKRLTQLLDKAKEMVEEIEKID